MFPPKQWYIVYTRPGYEKRVAGLLVKKDYEHYLPVNKVERQVAKKRVTEEEPLIASYLFIRATREEHDTIRAIEGIVNFVYWLTEPVVVKNDEIDTLKVFLHNYPNVRTEKLMMNGREPLKSTDRHVNLLHDTDNRHDTVSISLPSIGYVLIAAKQMAHIEKKTEYSIRNRYVRFLRSNKPI